MSNVLSRRSLGSLFALLCAWCMLCSANAARAADEEDEDEPKFAAGLVAEYRQGERTAKRVDQDIAFVWNAERPDERLLRGDFTAQWKGLLFAQLPGSYRFHFYAGGGDVNFTVGGKPVLTATAKQPAWHVSEPIALRYGHNPLELTFQRTSDVAQIKLHWSGPQFAVEPVPERNLFHDPKLFNVPGGWMPPTFEHGQLVARVLRCAACHTVPDGRPALPAPALTHVRGNVEPDWLVEHLTARGPSRADPMPARFARKMPYFGLSRADAQAIGAYLFSRSESSPTVQVRKPIERIVEPVVAHDPRKGDEPKKKKPTPRTEPTVRDGELLFESIGCLACHSQLVGGSAMYYRGTDSPFSGGDFTNIARKRTPEFFLRWLAEPAKVNVDHRMPAFPLSELERADLTAFLTTLRASRNPRETAAEKAAHAAGSDEANRNANDDEIKRGRELIVTHRCTSCHRLPADDARGAPRPLLPLQDWSESCVRPAGDVSTETTERQPRYELNGWDSASAIDYLRRALPPGKSNGAKSDPPKKELPYDGRFVLAERSCIACHARGLGIGIAAHVMSGLDNELLPVQAALLPPSLNGVGDKLTDEAMADAIELKRPPLRPWLKVRMPTFSLAPDELAALKSHLVDHDRIPDLPPPAASAKTEDDAAAATAQRLAARRLVTSDGFGCTSCHKIGKAEPAGIVNIAAHGTDLTLLGSRLRKPWFDRWVRNPARIIPRMEMPAIQLPVKGVLHDDIDEQLAAVWNVLNEPGFTPPLPNPVRIVRSRNVPDKDGKWNERANVLTDVFVVDGVTYDSAVVIGLPNRHNILFDLEHNRLAAWWTGDTAFERTKAKSWYWEPGGTMVVPLSSSTSADRNGQTLGEVAHVGNFSNSFVVGSLLQNLAELDSISHTPAGVTFSYRLGSLIKARQTFETLQVDPKRPAANGFRRVIEFEGAPLLIFDLLGLNSDLLKLEEGAVVVVRDAAGRPRVESKLPFKKNSKRAEVEVFQVADETRSIRFEASYLVDLPIDTFPNEIPPAQAPPSQQLSVVPGFEAVQLPITVAEMPTGLAWKKDGTLVFTSLKGRVVEARDSNGDGLEDALRPVSDDLAAPYGIAVAEQDGKEVLDVINKYGLVRLHDDDADGYRERLEVVASGWGHTDDYHDWAVGLPKIPGGGYYVALPCQQDNRDPKKATLRGQGLKLLPRTPTKDDPRRFSIEPFCGGLRFPMGLAVNKAGDLFASDNQGNYNPFNEINHLVPGARYGFINKLEAKPGFSPPVESPALELPHPWTRSVNGICFLDTPGAVRDRRRAAGLDENLFGEFEGHLIGCEYNYRSLYRMALEKVDGVYQGAAFPFSDLPKEKQPTFEGPVVCEVAPSGDLYVGNMQDSGWGGGRNTGSLVRLRPVDAKSANKLPAGIAAISAHADGFTLRFTQPIDKAAAADPASYTLESFRRISTPQYGGSDVDRAAVRVISAVPSADGRQVRLTLDKMKQGFVYEFHLRSLAPAGAPWFPAEAYYTLKRVPKSS